MRGERFGIYCFSDEKTVFAPVRYSEGTGQTIGRLLSLGAWVQKMIVDAQGSMPTAFPDVPSDFKPKILSYARLKELDPEKAIDRCKDNVFVILMPGFVPDNLDNLQLRLEARYEDYMRTSNICVMRDDKTEDIIEVKPNFSGVGLNLNAAWKKFFKRS